MKTKDKTKNHFRFNTPLQFPPYQYKQTNRQNKTQSTLDSTSLSGFCPASRSSPFKLPEV